MNQDSSIGKMTVHGLVD